MKILTTFILMLFMAKGCTNSEIKKESENISFEYEANTRGAYLKRLVKQDTAIAIKTRGGLPVQNTLAKNDWNSLLTLLSKVDVTKIPELKAPSDKRAYDGAMMAELKVIYKDKTYQTPTFDHGNPPAEIKDLVNKILEVSDLDKK